MSSLRDLLFGTRSLEPSLEARLARVERKLDAICDHLGLEVERYPGVSEQVADALRRGRKIEAIKRYREETGASLRDAKDAVDRAEYGD